MTFRKHPIALTIALGLILPWLARTTVAAEELHPIVDAANGYLFGASASGKWMKAEEVAKRMNAPAKYQVYGLTKSLGEATGGKPAPSTEDACSADSLTVALSPIPENGVIAIAAPWNALPRIPQTLDANQKVYVDAVRDFLKTKGIAQPKVKIDTILRVDLDGDGEPEVLISATNYLSKDDQVPMRSPAGSYSMVLLRRVVGGKVRTQLVAGEFYPKATGYNAPNAYKIMAVLDLDGDGKMEVVVDAQYYEGEGTTIYRCTRDKAEELLSVFCGL